MKVIKQHKDICLCLYDCGMWTVDRINKSIGQTLYSGSQDECEHYYNIAITILDLTA